MLWCRVLIMSSYLHDLFRKACMRMLLSYNDAAMPRACGCTLLVFVSHWYLGVSENVVYYPKPNGWWSLSLLNGYNWGYTPFSDKPTCCILLHLVASCCLWLAVPESHSMCLLVTSWRLPEACWFDYYSNDPTCSPYQGLLRAPLTADMWR